ncbi:uncharacterized protein LOC112906651 [Agrilus planipennis]|uniref:Uncharacterized protein LOC112906651 n=1 Tax=Agrilus planipennis TaxID=224129 RepID=A0A7F5RLU7_AGRPL|nr:uncharacterized protein LOC112906651 [Agrilus planipennis]
MRLLIYLMGYTLANVLAILERELRSDRHRRYLGLGRRFKINRRYQECVGPGDLPGHCKHPLFCAMNVVGSSKNPVEHLCVIEKTFVGVCCPDDILLSNIVGSRIIMDLPAGGEDYDEQQNFTMGKKKNTFLSCL